MEGQAFTIIALVILGYGMVSKRSRSAPFTAMMDFVLFGTGLRRPSALFLGGFGPRGPASILFALLVVRDAALPGSMDILAAVLLTAFVSVFAHGMTAWPGVAWYTRGLVETTSKPDLPENRPVPEMPLRLTTESRHQVGME